MATTANIHTPPAKQVSVDSGLIDDTKSCSSPVSSLGVDVISNTSSAGQNKTLLGRVATSEFCSIASGAVIERQIHLGDYGVFESAAQLGETIAGANTGHNLPGDMTFSGVMLINAFHQFLRAFSEVYHGLKSKDWVGAITGGLRTGRGLAQVTANSTAIVAATAGINGASGAIKAAAPTLVRVSSFAALAYAGIIFSYIAINFKQMWTTHHVLSESTKAEKGVDDNIIMQRGLESLKGLLTINKEDSTKILDDIFDNEETPWYTQVGIFFAELLCGKDEDYASKKQELKDHINKIGPDALLKDEGVEEVEKKLTQEQELILEYLKNSEKLKGKSEKELKNLLPYIEPLYKAQKLVTLERKEAIFARTFGSVVRDKVKQAMSSQEVSSAKEIVMEAKKEAFKNLFLYGAVMLTATITAGALIAAIVKTGGILLMAINVAIGIGWFLIDAYSKYDAFNSSTMTRGEKIYEVVTLLGVVVAQVLGVVLFENPIAEVATAAAAGFVMLLTGLYAAYKWKSKEEEKPLLEKG